MARVTRATKAAANTDTAVTTPMKHTADIPIRSIENSHDVPSKEAENKQLKRKKTSAKQRQREKEYQKKKRQQLIGTINASGKPYAEKGALRAEIYKPFRTKSSNHKLVTELQQLAEAQQQEIAVLKKQVAPKESSETGTPKATGSRRARKGGFK